MKKIAGKKLRLHRETVRVISNVDLAQVLGGDRPSGRRDGGCGTNLTRSYGVIGCDPGK
ncbi:MAG: hypothetical protein HY698_11710 [Deltaproteobacteria bacterium]|nr:hypothetical protein [Deltaproteobacteria bacterium]